MLRDDVAEARKRRTARGGVVLKVNSFVVHYQLGVDLDVEKMLGHAVQTAATSAGSRPHAGLFDELHCNNSHRDFGPGGILSLALF